MHGQELGWVCLASCAADVAVNALVRLTCLYPTLQTTNESYQAIFVVTASFDDHAESDHITTLKGDPRMGMAYLDSTSGQRLPIIRPGANGAPARGILEKRDREFQATDAISSTRSIRFSPESTLQSRSVAMTEIAEPIVPFELTDEEKRRLVPPAPPTPHPDLHDAHNSTFRSERNGHVRISRLGRQGMLCDNLFHLGV